MKKRVTFLAALLVAACFGATVAMAEGSAKVTAQSGLNMRQGPGINYNVVTVLNNGATVNVVTPDDGNGWAYVTSGKNAGWVATKYLSGSAATTQAPSWRGSAVNCTVKSDANIRRGPGTDFGVLGVVPAGFTVSVDSYQDGWASVTWGGCFRLHCNQAAQRPACRQRRYLHGQQLHQRPLRGCGCDLHPEQRRQPAQRPRHQL